MLKFLPFYFLLFFFQSISHAQVSMGVNRQYVLGRERMTDFPIEDLTDIKSTTLVFFYRKADESILPELEKALTSVWKVTPLKLVPYSQADKYLNEPNYSYASISTLINGEFRNSARAGMWELYLDFWINKPGKKRTKESFAWVYISTGSAIPAAHIKAPVRTASYGPYVFKAGFYNHTDYYRGDYMCDLAYRIKGNEELITQKELPMTDKYFNYLYTYSTFHNWTIPDLKTYFSIVNEHLLTGASRTFCQKERDDDQLKKLKETTLMIPEYAFLTPDLDNKRKDTLIYKRTSDAEIEKVLSAYPYTTKIVSTEELTKLIQDPSRTTYYISHVVNEYKTLTIINSRTRNIIYSNCRYVSKNEALREKDMILLKETIAGERK
ncbi:hypothetical protein QNI16_10355 [Cytophagaceae bacterium YF14B1]|uniref:Uncharacterized protein n=1 Tax=Xanthocytophaga flava TaxID=3048013 RepID=A0AAE3QL10_9BACT|nr:hypothetical protein [Xanthocytophaga flavus]MDJ1480885.1 hypothetical protein [Xanthocytophaga flavus]